MKSNYNIVSSFLLLILLNSFSFAQNPIPNPGFENWTEGNPDSWVTFDIPGVYDAVTQSDIARSGSSAARGEVVDVYGENAPPYLASDVDYFAISENYTRLTGYYQFSNNADELLWALSQFLDAENMIAAYGEVELGETSNGYTEFSLDMDYTFGSGQPATQAIIAFSIIESESDTLTLGTYFLIDDLEFDNVSNISEGSFGESPRAYRLVQNYPNPFNPTTSINFSIPQSGKVYLSVMNSIGQVVETLIDEQMTSGDHQVRFNAGNLPSGVYFYKLETGNFVDVKKMILIK